MLEDNFWYVYNNAQSDEPRDFVFEVLKLGSDVLKSDELEVLELGCGQGRDTKEFLRRGFSVSAVDIDGASLNQIQVEQSEKIKKINKKFEDLVLERNSYDLIYSHYSIPFCEKKSFYMFWENILLSLKKNGILAVQLLGDRDDWASDVQVTTLNFKETKSLFKGFELLKFEELEFSKPSFNQDEKKWHVYEVVAQKN